MLELILLTHTFELERIHQPDLPYTPGADCAGIVESVGSDVTQFKAGDPVFTVRTVTGSYAEYTVAESQHTYALNTQKLSFEHGASLGTPYFTTYRALVLRAKAKAGETVFVHGASGGVSVA
ncbi:CRYZ [Bugula neritina]|uniref:CRYZ n=1 Tax=Bugula neritina TaxID=10212 RepID=A0A7J7J115_BUGNE|nr:CRYZ [Bugula neritina]